jgi:uncharacterized protein YbcI
MNTSPTTMARHVARAATDFQQQRTGHAPKAVTAVLSGDTLVTTLRSALTPAEEALAKSAAGATQVQENYRNLFDSDCESLRQEIQRIIGVPVREAAAEVETTTGTVVPAFTSGTVVQVFRMAQDLTTKSRVGDGPHQAQLPQPYARAL